jgi:nitrogen fixation protein NifQ
MAYLSAESRSESCPSAPKSDAAEIYLRLRLRGGEGSPVDEFTAHVLACALAVCLSEKSGHMRDFAGSVGLGRDELRRMFELWFPAAGSLIDFEAQPESAEFDEEEDQVRQLLERFRGDDSPETSWLIAILTKRSMSPRHLWQDLGLIRRDELGRLMAQRFPKLAERNVNHMKWKKFLYRSLCELEGFVLCASPTCRECSDFHDCFGDESGESALARIANPNPSSAGER